MARTNLQNEMQSKLESLNKLEETYNDIISRTNTQEEKLSEKLQFRAERARVINELEENRANLTQKQLRALRDLKKVHDEETVDLKIQTAQLKEQNKQLQRQIEARRKILKGVKEIAKATVETWKYLMAQDKAIKSTILSLGMSGQKADLMRQSFEQSAQGVIMLGGNVEDIGKIQQGFADETGKARAMTGKMVEDVIAMGKGTGLGVENATKLAAQFEFMGYDVKNTMTWVQGVVDTTERMGINTTKVLKSVNDNFRKLSTFTFKKGVQGFAEMAISAEKTRVDMGSTLNLAEATRSLDKVIELGAQLQVMGGNFAKIDPLQWFYTSRNEPEKLVDMISDMTKGIATFKKNAHGSLDYFISPANQDRLRNVGKALGKSNEEMTQIAQRQLDLSTLDKQLAGKGWGEDIKDWVKGAAVLNRDTAEYMVSVNGTQTSIANLTKEQAKAFQQEQSSLKERAEEAQTFDEVFKNTVNAMKAGLLPILKNINNALTWIRNTKLFQWLTESKSWEAAAIKLIVAGSMIKGASMGLKAAGSGLFKLVDKNKDGGVFNNLTGSQALGKGKGMMYAGKGAGMSSLGKGAGIGLAAAGTGTGIMLAAKGISELADSMSKLDGTQIWALPATVGAIALAFGAAIIPVAAMGAAAATAWPGLLALGAATVGIGFGVNLAAKGIGQMIGNFDKIKEGTGMELLKIAGGITAINVAMATTGLIGGLGGLLGGFATLNKTLGIFDNHKEGLTAAGTAFGGLSTILTGSKEDFIAVENAVKAISSANVGKGGLIAELANLIKQPLKVEWANDGKVQLVNDVTLNIDGEKFMNKVYKVDLAATKQVSAKGGIGGK